MQARPDRPLPGHTIKIGKHLRQPHILRLDLAPHLPAAPPRRKAMREPQIKRHRVLDLIDILNRQLQPKRLNIPLEMRDRAAPADGKHIRRLVQNVRERNRRDSRLLRLGNLLELARDLDLLVRRGHHLAALGGLALLLGLEVAAAQRAPRRQPHALGPAHGDDVALEVARCRRPEALVDDEGAQAVGARVFVGFADHPGRGVADAEVEDGAGGDEVVQGVHELGDGGCVVPPAAVGDGLVVRGLMRGWERV